MNVALLALNHSDDDNNDKGSKLRRLYAKPTRTAAMVEIRRLIVAGYTYDEIMSELRIPRRTFFRYLNLLFKQDKKRLEETNDAEAMHQFTVLRDRLTKQYRAADQLANNEEIDVMARIKARHLACELAVAIQKLNTEGPAIKKAQRKSFLQTTSSPSSSHGQSEQEKKKPYWNPVLKKWTTLPPSPYDQGLEELEKSENDNAE